MHKREIMRLFGKVKQDGYALIPLSVYLKGSRVKVKVGLCKGKKLYDKRQAAAERDAKRQMDRAMKRQLPTQKENIFSVVIDIERNFLIIFAKMA
jgi:SsrA-binding protein